MAKILVCVPSMDMVSAGFAQSLAMLQKGGHEVAIMFQVGSLIYDSRNKLAKKALEMEADYTMWFDSDMTFEPDTMLRLLAHKAPIVSGAYFRRSPPYHLVAFDDCDPKTGKHSDLPLPTDTVKCGGVGFGCVLVSTDVLFEVASKFTNWFEPINGFGEDLSFCWRARECGFDILLDPSISCGHMGHILVNETFYKAYAGGKTNEG